MGWRNVILNMAGNVGDSTFTSANENYQMGLVNWRNNGIFYTTFGNNVPMKVQKIFLFRFNIKISMNISHLAL